eukprot:scaffold36543_cov121-Isochrysis_galbana.AAC.2
MGSTSGEHQGRDCPKPLPPTPPHDRAIGPEAGVQWAPLLVWQGLVGLKALACRGQHRLPETLSHAPRNLAPLPNATASPEFQPEMWAHRADEMMQTKERTR